MASDKFQLGRPRISNRSATKYFDAKSNSVVKHHFDMNLHSSFLPELGESRETTHQNAFRDFES